MIQFFFALSILVAIAALALYYYVIIKPFQEQKRRDREMQRDITDNIYEPYPYDNMR